MSEIEKKNQAPNLNADPFDDEDDLWAIQSTETSNPKQIDFIEEEKETSTKLAIESEEQMDVIKTEANLVTEVEDNLTESNLENSENVAKKPEESLPPEKLELEPESSEQESIITAINSELEDNNQAQGDQPDLIITDKKEDKIDDLSKANVLQTEIRQLEQQKKDLIQQQGEISNNINLLVQEGLRELEQKKQNLELTIQKLERRRERVEKEMKTTFAGVSQDLAIRVQGFKDYLVGSLQDLAASAEQLELPSASLQTWESTPAPEPETKKTNPNPQFADKSFKQEARQIRSLLDQNHFEKYLNNLVTLCAILLIFRGYQIGLEYNCDRHTIEIKSTLL